MTAYAKLSTPPPAVINALNGYQGVSGEQDHLRLCQKALRAHYLSVFFTEKGLARRGARQAMGQWR